MVTAAAEIALQTDLLQLWGAHAGIIENVRSLLRMFYRTQGRFPQGAYDVSLQLCFAMGSNPCPGTMFHFCHLVCALQHFKWVYFCKL